MNRQIHLTPERYPSGCFSSCGLARRPGHVIFAFFPRLRTRMTNQRPSMSNNLLMKPTISLSLGCSLFRTGSRRLRIFTCIRTLLLLAAVLGGAGVRLLSAQACPDISGVWTTSDFHSKTTTIYPDGSTEEDDSTDSGDVTIVQVG